MTWLPQNDVLAHPRTKAFLSHVGINSMYEVASITNDFPGMIFAANAETTQGDTSFQAQ